MPCKLNLQFGDSLSGCDGSTRTVTVMGSGRDQFWSVDATAGSTTARLSWSRHSVSLSAPGAFAGGSVANPTGLLVSADGKTATFNHITVTAQVGGTASVNGTVDCAGG